MIIPEKKVTVEELADLRCKADALDRVEQEIKEIEKEIRNISEKSPVRITATKTIERIAISIKKQKGE